MRFFRWNSFSIIGIILLAIGIYSAFRGATFQFDPGLPPGRFEWLYYIVVGILMTINGLVVPPAISAPPGPDGTATAPERSASGAAQPR